MLFNQFPNPYGKFVRYDNLSAFENYLESASSQLLKPLYLILGKDFSECQEAIHFLLRILLPSEDMRAFALIVLEGAHLEETTLKNALCSESLFAKSEVKWIKQADKLNKSAQEYLEKYCNHPVPNQFLIISAPNWQKNSSFYRIMEREGVVLDLADVKPWEKEKQLIAWINKQVAARRKLMSYPVCQLLVKWIGNDRALLIQEMEKLLCYCGEKKEITQQDVENICFHQEMHSIWQLGESIFHHNTAAALQLAYALLMEGQSLLPLLRQIRSQFQTGYQICLLLAQGKLPQEITQEFPYMKGQILDRHLQQAQRYGLKAFKKGLLAIDTAELRTKNSTVDEHILLELLIMQLTYTSF